MENRFPYSFNEKRYHTFNYYLKSTYGKKVAKVVLDGGFTCPNRDGKKGYGGCIYCSNKGSGDANVAISSSIREQYELNKSVMARKWPDSLYLPYFQSFSNTYGPLDKIKGMLKPFLELDEVAEIAIATRCDCLSNECISYLDEVSHQKTIWLEIGLQTSNDKTGEYINRGHSFNEFKEILEKLAKTHIKVCVHILNGLPHESYDDMIKTIKDINHLPFAGIKIHMLHILKDTRLHDIYQEEPFDLLTRDEYINLVVEQLRYLRPEVIIQRLTGDPLADELVAPDWVRNKTTILNDIDKLMRKHDYCQGDLYEE